MGRLHSVQTGSYGCHTRYRKDEHGNEMASQLIECTELCDKIRMLRRTGVVPGVASEFMDGTVEKLRNELAHPSLKEGSSLLLSRDRLWKFIEWLEELDRQLRSFLDSGGNLQAPNQLLPT